MSTEAGNNYSTPWDNSYDEEVCNRLRNDFNWWVSMRSYQRMSKAVQRCFDIATFFNQNDVKNCWDPCEDGIRQGRTSCWINPRTRNCIMLPSPDLGDIWTSNARLRIL
jgi:hypothetical protein